jgi:hypothetical protein
MILILFVYLFVIICGDSVVILWSNDVFTTNGIIPTASIVGNGSVCYSNITLNSTMPPVCDTSTVRLWIGGTPTPVKSMFPSSSKVYWYQGIDIGDGMKFNYHYARLPKELSTYSPTGVFAILTSAPYSERLAFGVSYQTPPPILGYNFWTGLNSSGDTSINSNCNGWTSNLTFPLGTGQLGLFQPNIFGSPSYAMFYGSTLTHSIEGCDMQKRIICACEAPDIPTQQDVIFWTNNNVQNMTGNSFLPSQSPTLHRSVTGTGSICYNVTEFNQTMPPACRTPSAIPTISLHISAKGTPSAYHVMLKTGSVSRVYSYISPDYLSVNGLTETYYAVHPLGLWVDILSSVNRSIWRLPVNNSWWSGISNAGIIYESCTQSPAGEHWQVNNSTVNGTLQSNTYSENITDTCNTGHQVICSCLVEVPITTSPTLNPSNYPSTNPTKNPSKNPTQPTTAPSSSPSVSPTTASPSKSPSKNPTKSPSNNPTRYPTQNPTIFTGDYCFQRGIYMESRYGVRCDECSNNGWVHFHVRFLHISQGSAPHSQRNKTNNYCIGLRVLCPTARSYARMQVL